MASDLRATLEADVDAARKRFLAACDRYRRTSDSGGGHAPSQHTLNSGGQATRDELARVETANAHSLHSAYLEVEVAKMEYDDALIRLHRAYDEERAHERDADERSWRARVADEAKARDADERSWRARVADEAKARDAAASARELAAAGLNERGMKLQEAIRDDAVKRDLVATKSQKTMTRATVAYVVLTAAILLTAGVQAWAALKQAGAPPPVLTATSVAPPATSK